MNRLRRFLSLVQAVLCCWLAPPIAAQVTPRDQAGQLEAQAKSLPTVGSEHQVNRREVARLWHLAAALWHEEAIEAVVEQNFPRYSNASRNGHFAIIMAAYWAARGCPQAGFPIGSGTLGQESGVTSLVEFRGVFRLLGSLSVSTALTIIDDLRDDAEAFRTRAGEIGDNFLGCVFDGS